MRMREVINWPCALAIIEWPWEFFTFKPLSYLDTPYLCFLYVGNGTYLSREIYSTVFYVRIPSHKKPMSLEDHRR